MSNNNQSDCLQMTPPHTSFSLQKTTAKNSQEDFQALERWDTDWVMDFHPDKCSVIRMTRKKTIDRYPYTFHGQILAKERNTKYLEVTSVDNMMWNTHIGQTAAKGTKKLGFLKRNFKINDPDIKSYIYMTLIRPSLEYYSTVWDSHTHT